MTYTVALIGGIGSGKTTVSNLFKKIGVKIIDTDVIAKEILTHNQTIVSNIVKRYGSQCLNIDKSINRKYLRNYMFLYKKEKLWLEQLLHPEIIKNMEKKIKEPKKCLWILLVIPLLIEMQLYQYSNRILLVDTPIQQQFLRTIKRDKISKIQAKLIITSQTTRLKRLSIANDIINNDSTINSLKFCVEKLNNYYSEMSTKNISKHKIVTTQHKGIFLNR
ncbi:MAG: dephospho-CoA kinase [Buchnera aphidicola (Nurudea shiraii)]